MTARKPARKNAAKAPRQIIPKKWSARSLVAVLLAGTVSFSVAVMALLAVIDVLNPPKDPKLAENLISLTRTVLTATISLVGVYLGASVAADSFSKNDKDTEDDT